MLDRRDVLRPEFITHLKVVASALAIATVVGLVLGLIASRVQLLESAVIGLGSAILTVPSFALFGILTIWTGIGDQPVRIGLILYALLPIVRNTDVGLRGTEPSVLDAARGMGMNPRQVLTRVEFPLAAPLIIAGIRQAGVLIVAIATVGAAVGSNNLGQPIFEGIRSVNRDAILSGAVPVAIIGILLDLGLLGLEQVLKQRGVTAS
jgi:osmoprotectant transport system permease protein